MSATSTSPKGVKFQGLHEGTVLNAYWDPATPPVATVGRGFTNKSDVVTRMIGKIVPGKTKITEKQCDEIHLAVLAEEVDPVIRQTMPGATQFEFDAASSGSYNLGARRFMSWNWADLWREGFKKEAWAYLSKNYNTAGGKPLPGLVRRRKEEAILGATGFYTGIDRPSRAPAGISIEPTKPEGVPRRKTAMPKKEGADPVVLEAQELLTAAGFNPGAIDGWLGENTEKAILAYQQSHPHLHNDGILGPATLAQLRRDYEAGKTIIEKTVKNGGGGAVATGIASFLAGLPWQWIALAVVVVVAGFFLWRYRDIFARRLNSKRGKVVEL